MSSNLHQNEEKTFFFHTNGLCFTDNIYIFHVNVTKMKGH